MNRLVAFVCSLLVLVLSALPAAAQSDYRKTYRSDMQAFVDQVDAVYPFLELKGIKKEWRTMQKRLLKEAKKCKRDTDFMQLVFDGIACLRDAHMAVTACEVEFPEREPVYYTGASFLAATKKRVVIMYPPDGKEASLPTGTVVLKINGKDARKFLEARAEAKWEAGGGFSSLQRARLFEYRYALEGERSEKFELQYLDGKQKKKAKLTCRTEMSGWPHTYNLPKDLVRVGKSFYYSKLPSGLGYMYLRRVDSSITEGMAEALGAHADVKGWIIDLRGNSGGGYDDKLLTQVKAIPGPVAAIIDAGCISAGETLARDLVNLAGARVFGTTSAGSSSSKRIWQFPSGIASIKFSTRTRTGINGIPIEFNGITPHEPTEVVPEEAQAGLNSSIQRAEEYLLSQ